MGVEHFQWVDIALVLVLVLVRYKDRHSTRAKEVEFWGGKILLIAALEASVWISSWSRWHDTLLHCMVIFQAGSEGFSGEGRYCL